MSVIEISSNPKEFNSFTVVGKLISGGVPVIIAQDADTLLNNIDTVGLARFSLYSAKSNQSDLTVYTETDDRVDTFDLENRFCYTRADNSNEIYYTVRGGVAAGTYQCTMTYESINEAGQWNPRLSNQTIIVTVDSQPIVIS